jgi:serine protease
VPVRAAESADTDRRPVRGLIVEMRAPAARATETPQAVRERVRSAAQASGIVSTDLRALTERHHHLRFATVTDIAQARALATRLRANPEVLSVEPDVLIRRQAVTPNDPLFTSRQWNLQAAGARAAAINMPAAWAVTTGTPVTVAVVDSGILPHPELAGRILPGYDFVSEVEFANDGNGRDADPSDPGDWVSVQDQRTTVFAGCDVATSSWHGTFIAGQIAAVADNGEGIAGIHWNGRILPVRVSGKCGAFLSDLLDGLRWSAGLAVTGAPANANPARVINLSLGGDAACSSAYQSVIDEVTAAGTLIVAAGGNEGGAVRRPADCRNVFAVGAGTLK